MSFVRVAHVRDVPVGAGRPFSVGRYEVALFNLGGEFFALENNCPHQGGPLAEGWVENEQVTCPWHGWCFDIRSGRMALGDFALVPRFRVRREGDDLYVSVEPIE